MVCEKKGIYIKTFVLTLRFGSITCIMYKRFQHLLFLLVLSCVLTGFVVEHWSLFNHGASLCLNESDTEKGDQSDVKKFGEDDTFRPERYSVLFRLLISSSKAAKPFPPAEDLLHPLATLAILTPPPERG